MIRIECLLIIRIDLRGQQILFNFSPCLPRRIYIYFLVFALSRRNSLLSIWSLPCPEGAGEDHNIYLI